MWQYAEQSAAMKPKNKVSSNIMDTFATLYWSYICVQNFSSDGGCLDRFCIFLELRFGADNKNKVSERHCFFRLFSICFAIGSFIHWARTHVRFRNISKQYNHYTWPIYIYFLVGASFLYISAQLFFQFWKVFLASTFLSCFTLYIYILSTVH